MKRGEVQKNDEEGLRPSGKMMKRRGGDEKVIPKGAPKGTLKSISRRDAAERRRAIYLTQPVFFIAKLFWWCCCACYLYCSVVLVLLLCMLPNVGEQST